MTKAQEVRKRRVEKKKEDINITAQAEKIFDWILDLIDADTKKGYYGSVEVYLPYGYNKLHSSKDASIAYDLSDILIHHDRVELFRKLEEIVDKEDSFAAILKINDRDIYTSRCISFRVVMD